MPTTRGNTTYRPRTGQASQTRNTTTTTSKTAWNPSKFGSVRQDLQCRIGSYQNIYSQVSGQKNVTTFSPTTATRWTNMVNKGARVYKFNTQQIKTGFGNQWTPDLSPNTAARFLRQKYGNGIKAVAKGRGNTWLVATTTTINKGPFKNYNWK